MTWSTSVELNRVRRPVAVELTLLAVEVDWQTRVSQHFSLLLPLEGLVASQDSSVRILHLQVHRRESQR